jgi:endonuclease/exonuclease/phosphatase family metal-dependent hydrolase
MKIATFNVQNLFHRDKSLLEKPFGKNLTDWINELDTLMRKPSTSFNEQNRIRELSFLIGFEKPSTRPYAVLRRKAGFLYLKGLNYSTETKASHLTNWNGWIEIQNTPIKPEATDNKARVVADVNPDILLLQEIEDRASLEEFNQLILPKFDCQPYEQSFVVQSEALKGLELGILLRKNYTLKSIKTHGIKSLVEYEIEAPNQQIIHLISVKLEEQTKDKNYIDAIRKNQARDIAEIYDQHITEGKTNIIIAGTLNAPSYCHSLSPLIQQTELKDITKHLSFEVDCDTGNDAKYHRLGAYQKGVNIKQKDYILFSPSIFDKMIDSGLNRKAMWPEKRPQWSIYKSLTNKNVAASEHPLVWGKIDI